MHLKVTTKNPQHVIVVLYMTDAKVGDLVFSHGEWEVFKGLVERGCRDFGLPFKVSGDET